MAQPQTKRPNPPAPPPVKRPWRGRTAALLALLGFTLAGWLLGPWAPSRRPSVSFVFAGSGYQRNIAVPVNVHAWQGLEETAQALRSHQRSAINSRPIQVFEPREVEAPSDWDADLADASGRTVFVFLALHGGTDRKGAFLLTASAFQENKPGQGSVASLDPEPAKLRIDDVLNRLQHLAQGQNVVLVLEPTQLTALPALGVLHNNFARELEKVNRRITEIPNLVVLCASDADQRAWSSDALKQSVFGHFLLEGLKGEAGTQTLAELARQTFANVDRWAQAQRGVRQTPILFPRGDEGWQRADRIVLPRIQVPRSDRAPAPFSPPAELAEMWNEHATLRQQSPLPGRSRSECWRLLDEWLLRYEQLVQAGAGADARFARQRYQDLRRTLLDSSAETTFQPLMPAGALPVPEELLVRFETWWKETDSSRTLQDMRELDRLGRHPGWRAAWSRWLCVRSAEEPYRNLPRAAPLAALTDGDEPRSPEGHFLVMLNRDLPGLSSSQDRPVTIRLVGQSIDTPRKVPADLIRLALGTRLAAEQAAWGTSIRFEEVAAWIGPTIEQADLERRRGEDLLFGDDASAWDQARPCLERALDQYRKIQHDAERLTGVLGVRDRWGVELPALGRWLANAGPDPSPAELSLESWEALLQRWQHLVDQLDQPGIEKLTTLVTQASDLNEECLALVRLAQEHAKVLTEPTTPAGWRALDASLAWSGADPAWRMRALIQRSQLGLQLDFQSAGEAPADPAGLRWRALEQARRRGRLALALAGKQWFNACGAELEGFDQVQQRLNKLSLDSRWWDVLTVAGEEIAQRCRRLPEEIRRRSETKSSDRARLADLAASVRGSRHLDTGGAAALTSSPGTVYRQLLMGQFLFDQARRTELDHWHGEQPGAEPYYRRRGELLLNQARTLVGNASAEPELAARLRRDDKIELRLLDDNAMPLSGETAPRTRFQIQSPDLAGPALAWWWLEAGSSQTSERRQRVNLGRPNDLYCQRPAENSAARVEPVSTSSAKQEMALHAYWRGQHVRKSARLEAPSEPAIRVVEHPLPQRAGLAVRTTPDCAECMAWERSLRQRLRYWIDREDHRPLPGFGEVGLEIGQDPESDQWLPGGLVPGPYLVRVHTQQRLIRPVMLAPSDLLLVGLVPSRAHANQFELERLAWAQTDFPWKPSASKGPWRLALLQNQRLPGQKVQLLAALEKQHDSMSASLQQCKPAKVWIEAAPEIAGDGKTRQEWHYQTGYPASAWSMDLDNWPTQAGRSEPARPIVRAWWSMEAPRPQVRLSQGTDFVDPGQLSGRALPGLAEGALLESVRVEEQEVEVQPGTSRQAARREKKPCLVVRVRHRPGSTIWVNLAGLPGGGSEHRYYPETGQVVAVFWPVTPERLASGWWKLEFHSLEQFKKQAEEARCALTLDRLYEPQANETRPTPLMDLERASPEGDPRVIDPPPHGRMFLVPPPSVSPVNPTLAPPTAPSVPRKTKEVETRLPQPPEVKTPLTLPPPKVEISSPGVNELPKQPTIQVFPAPPPLPSAPPVSGPRSESAPLLPPIAPPPTVPGPKYDTTPPLPSTRLPEAVPEPPAPVRQTTLALPVPPAPPGTPGPVSNEPIVIHVPESAFKKEAEKSGSLRRWLFGGTSTREQATREMPSAESLRGDLDTVPGKKR